MVLEKEIRKVIIIVFLIGLNINLFAHPHVFINESISIDFNKNGICGLKVKWAFDEMFTELMMEDYDADGNKQFNEKEILRLHDEAFVNLVKFNYFTNIYIGNTLLKIKDIRDFNADYKNGQMIYSFYIPLEIKVTADKDMILDIYPYDESYYMDIVLDDDKPVLINNGQAYNTTYSIGEDETKAYYFNQIYPQVIHFKCRRK